MPRDRRGAHRLRRLVSADALDVILDRVAPMTRPSGRPFVIGISGFGGAGKTTLANRLVDRLDGAAAVHMDSFCTGDVARRSDDWDIFDRDRLVGQVLRPAWQADAIRYQEFDWDNEVLGDWTSVDSTAWLIVEGASVLHPPLRRWQDLAVWVDCPLEVTVQRGMSRDRERGLDHDELWQRVWAPNDRDYFERFRPDRAADLVVPCFG